jgi:hypothetical protein
VSHLVERLLALDATVTVPPRPGRMGAATIRSSLSISFNIMVTSGSFRIDQFK